MTGAEGQRLENCRLFDGQRVLDSVSLMLQDGFVRGIEANKNPKSSVDAVNLNGNLLVPGFIDIQVNGGGGLLFNDAPDTETLAVMARAHRQYGTTAFLPTLISDSADVIASAINAVARAREQGMAEILGIHIEGPHLNPQFCGVHDAVRIRPLDDDSFHLLTSMQDGITLVTLAPETVSPERIRRFSEKGIIVFAGHSGASYEETKAGLEAGIQGFTHLFNAMTPLTSRAPGMVGAALEDTQSYAGIIADGYHVHPSVLRLALRARGTDHMVLVTDAMPTVGSKDKHFYLYGELITSREGRCLTADGRLAGSDMGMIQAVKNIVEFGCADLFEAIRMASLYPARALGVEHLYGTISTGRRADLLELDGDLNIVRSWVAGQMLEH